LYHDMNNLIGNRPLSKALEGGIESEVDLDQSTNEETGNKIVTTYSTQSILNLQIEY